MQHDFRLGKILRCDDFFRQADGVGVVTETNWLSRSSTYMSLDLISMRNIAMTLFASALPR